MKSNFIKKCLLALGLSCVGFAVFAQASSTYNWYKDVPEEVMTRINAADELISQKKFLSAVQALGKEDNEYIIYKKVQIYTEYSIKNDGNKKFYLRDLQENEDLQELKRAEEVKKSNPLVLKSYDVTQAVTKFQKKNKNKNMPILNLSLGNIYSIYLMKFDTTAKDTKNKNLKMAKENLELADSLGFYDAYSLDYLAYIASIENNWDKFFEYFERLVVLRPNYFDPYFNMMVVSGNQKKYDKAIEYGKRALAVATKPKDIADVSFFIAQSYNYKNDDANAKKILEKTKKTVGNSADGSFLLGKIYWLDEKNYEKAEAEFIESILTNQNALIYVVEFLLSKDGDKKKALGFCVKAKTLFPNDNEYQGRAALEHCRASMVNQVAFSDVVMLLAEAGTYFRHAGVFDKYENIINSYEQAIIQLATFK